MGKKTDIKTCRYEACPCKTIDITKDDYTVVGKCMYYHTECLKKKKAGEWKDNKTKADLQYIKNEWVLHIDKTVVFSQLFRELNNLLLRGISSDYLVFVFDYIVKNKLPLRFPGGFKYFVSKKEIQDAYQKQQSKKNHVDLNSFTATDSTNTPSFTPPKKQFGFGSILGGNK